MLVHGSVPISKASPDALHALCAPCLRVCACGAWTSTLAFGGVVFAVARGIARGNAKRRIGAEAIGMNAGGKLWLSSALGSRPTSASRYWTSLSGAKFRGWTLRQVLKCGKRTIGPYRRLITRHELGGWNVVLALSSRRRPTRGRAAASERRRSWCERSDA